VSELPLASQVPTNDLSGQLLGKLLGPGWDTLAPQTGVEEAASLIRQVLTGFNYLALTAVSFLFVWYIVRAMTQTAREGSFGGRRFGGMWLPLRLAGALTFAAPVYQGLSIFQAGLLLAIGYSVNLANFVWAEGLDFFEKHGGKLTLQAPASVVEDGRELGRGILTALTIQEYYGQRLERPLTGLLAQEVFYPPAGTAGGQLIVSLNPPPGSALAVGDLGRIRLPCDSLDSTICQARLSAVRSLMTALGPTARALANLDVSLDQVPGDELARAVLAYQEAISPYLSQEADSTQSELKGDLRKLTAEAQENGWLMAGAYYWTITGLSRKGIQTLHQPVVFSDGEAKGLTGEVLSDFEAVQSRYERYLDNAYSEARALGLRGVPAAFPSVEWFSDKISGALGRYGLDRLTSHLAQGDPVAALASLGHFLIGAAETVIGLKVLTMALAQGSQNSSTSFLGQIISTVSGSVSSFLTGLAGGTVAALGPYLTALSLLLLGYGFFLAYFLPALPLVFWLSGVLGWLMVVLESLIAAPLWLAVHALPEGDGLTSRASTKGYFIFLGVLLRPPLMVLGFLMAMALLNLLGRLGGQAMTILGEEIFQNSFLGVSGFLALSAILGGAVVASAYKLFGLTSHLAERVVGWIGQDSHHLGESSDAYKAQTSFGVVTNVGGAAIKETVDPKAPRGPTP
jgi:hypothetical protein